MRTPLRSYDRIGRYGGEEFLIMALSCNRTCALSVAERIRDCISARPIQISGEELIVTSSLGVAVSCAGVREDAGSLIAAADEALYRAKNGGRNRVECAARDEV
jgi:diguanylate cyclase (GGDEF)-like protein